MGVLDERAAMTSEQRHARLPTLMATELNRVSGLLEEVATVWRRAERYGQQPSSSIAPSNLQGAARDPG